MFVEKKICKYSLVVFKPCLLFSIKILKSQFWVEFLAMFLLIFQTNKPSTLHSNSWITFYNIIQSVFRSPIFATQIGYTIPTMFSNFCSLCRTGDNLIRPSRLTYQPANYPIPETSNLSSFTGNFLILGPLFFLYRRWSWDTPIAGRKSEQKAPPVRSRGPGSMQTTLFHHFLVW